MQTSETSGKSMMIGFVGVEAKYHGTLHHTFKVPFVWIYSYNSLHPTLLLLMHAITIVLSQSAIIVQREQSACGSLPLCYFGTALS